MAKMKNDDFMRDARAILDRLVLDTKAPKALANQAERFYAMNDGRYAFRYAHLADFMENDLPRYFGKN